jgi:hypothetical protein
MSIIEFKPSFAKRYEDRYGQYLDFFKSIAEDNIDVVTVARPPWSWVPLLSYLKCDVVLPIHTFESCSIVRRALWHSTSPVTGLVAVEKLSRTAVEVFCAFRPELVDALYKIDCQWNIAPNRKTHYAVKSVCDEFLVTNNASFFRHEVFDFGKVLDTYMPTKKNVLLVPCAADKPYPAPLHRACLGIMPDDFYLANATGVLGIVPQDLWSVMPYYDSGIPNQWRLYEIAKKYFTRYRHDRVVVYCDFYAHVLYEVWNSTDMCSRIDFVLSPEKYDNYENLLSPENLAKLKAAFCDGSAS